MSETEESTELPQESLEYFGDELAARTFIEKYALREEGKLQETHPRQMWERVARAMASVEEEEEWQKKFYELLEDFTFVPGGRIMHGAGVSHSATLTNCLSYETKIITGDGVKKIGKLEGEEVELLTKENKWVEAPIKSFGTQRLMKVILQSGDTTKTIFATPDHRWFVETESGRKEALTKNIKEGDRLSEMYDSERGKEDKIEWIVNSVESTDRVEEVYCATVDKYGAFTLEGNILTGNCYVRSIEDDSIEGIFDWCKDAARTYSYGGGMGTDIGILRPRGAPVDNTARTSSGATSFMELFSTVTGTIGQRGRRGALLLSCPVDHPDIEHFVKAKAHDEDSVRYANISVKTTDDFMKAVENGDESFTTSFENDEVDRIEKEINPQELWDDIVTGAHQNAEPGVLFWDHIKRESPSEYNSPVRATNPCLARSERIVTSEGLRKIGDIEDEDGVKVLNGVEEWTEVEGPFSTGENELYEVNFKPKITVEATGYHEWILEDGTRKQTTKLEEGDKIKTNYSNNWLWENDNLPFEHENDFKGENGKTYSYNLPQSITPDLAFVSGFIEGDGHIAESGIHICCHEETQVFDFLLSKFDRWESNYSIYNRKGREQLSITAPTVAEYFEKLNEEHFDGAPSWVFQAPQNVAIAWVAGLFMADGTVNARNPDKVDSRISQSNKTLLQDVQDILATLGLQSGLYKRHEAGKQDFNDGYGEYDTKANYELIMYKDGSNQWKNIAEEYLFDSRLKKLNSIDINRQVSNYVRVKSVERTEKIEETYCLTEPNTNSFIVRGALTSGNCGEQPLPSGGECVLGHVNLSSIVQDQFTDDAHLNWDKLKSLTRRGVRFLDNVVEYNLDKHPHEDQAEQACNTRRIGLGVTGLGDMLAKLKVAYDSEEALDIVDEVMEFIRDHAYKASINLAEEKEPFPEFDADQHLDQPFIQRLPEDIREGIREHGLRNVCLLTVAPVGSGSVLTQTSSGVEPIFDIGYQRRSESLSEENYEVDHQLVAEYLDQEGGDVEELPGYFVTAHDIDPFFRVDMQATLQQYVDSAISSTINLPEDIDVETVKDLYMRAWKKGCKGVTVYRENSREGILITDEASEDEEVPEERPKSLEGETFKFKIKDEEGKPRNSYVTVNEHDGKPYETFVSPTREGSDALARMTSLALRYNVPMGEVLDQLKKGATNMYSPGQVIAKALQSMGREGGVECPECGEMGLQHENGCKTCYECGHSACG